MVFSLSPTLSLSLFPFFALVCRAKFSGPCSSNVLTPGPKPTLRQNEHLVVKVAIRHSASCLVEDRVLVGEGSFTWDRCQGDDFDVNLTSENS